MKLNTPLKVQLKDNSNITFEIEPQFCKCGRPMFLKQSHNGDIFWACKGFHKDRNLAVCDLTKDVKCFKCHSGEIKKKINKSTGDIFYGCSNYSEVSESSCNLKLQPSHINDIIRQVNDALKYRFDFKSISYNKNDEIKWEKLNRTPLTNKTTNIQPKENNIEKKTWYKVLRLVLGDKKNINTSGKNSSDSSKRKIFGLSPKIAAYVATLVVSVGLIASLNGSNVEISLFGDLFKINISPATSEDVDIRVNNKSETIVIENTRDEAIDISNLAIKTDGLEMIDFGDLPNDKLVLGPNEKLILNESDLLSLVNDMQLDEGSDPSIFNPGQDPDDNSYEAEEDLDIMKSETLEKLWKGDSSVEFVAEVIEQGRIKYEEINQKFVGLRNKIDEKKEEYLEIKRDREDELQREEFIRETEPRENLILE